MFDAENLFKKTSQEYSKRYKDIFKRADAAGARVVPEETAGHVQSLLATIAKETPAAAGRKGIQMNPGAKELQRYLTEEVAPIFKVTKKAGRTVAPQTFEQMDNLMEGLNKEITKLVKAEGMGKEVARLEGLKNKIKIDMYTKIQGQGGPAIGRDFQALDEMYSLDMANLFETTAAKKFGAVRAGGLQAMGFDTNTRQSLDSLSEILLRGENVSEIAQLKRLVEAPTFNKMAAFKLENVIESSVVRNSDGAASLDVGRLRKSLGMDQPHGKKFQYMQALLKESGGLSMNDIDKMLTLGQKIASIEAPSASTFVARRGTMGGFHAILGSVLPGAAVTAGTGSFSSGLITSAMMIGGSRLLGKMITDPLAARSLHLVMKPEVKKAVKKAAWLQGMRIVANGMEELSEDERSNLFSWIKGTADLLDKSVRFEYSDTAEQIPHSP